MKKSKIIIEIRDDILDEKALEIVSRVVSRGKISNDGKNYCYLVVDSNQQIEVYSTQLKSGTFKFLVCKEYQ